MTALSPSFDALLATDRALVTLLIEVALPAHNLRLLAGSGSLTWGAKTFTDADSIFGTLAGIDAIEDGDGDQAPLFGFSMFPPSDTAAATLCDPTYQGAPVSVWLAGVYPATGSLVPDPYLIFSGLLDQPTLKVSKSSREVDFQCGSIFDLLLEDDEGARLSDSFHQSNWPGETGFKNVTGIERDIYWGMADPNGGSGVVYGSSLGGMIGGIISQKRAD